MNMCGGFGAGVTYNLPATSSYRYPSTKDAPSNSSSLTGLPASCGPSLRRVSVVVIRASTAFTR